MASSEGSAPAAAAVDGSICCLFGLPHPGLVGVTFVGGKKTLSEDIVVLLLFGLVGPLGIIGGGGALVIANLKEKLNEIRLSEQEAQ